MAIFRVERTRDYTVMSNHHLKNKTLSFRAVGLLSVMLSVPDNWDYTLAGLATLHAESIDAVRSALLELEKAGYVERNRIRNEQGQLKETEYVIREKPSPEEAASDKPMLEPPILAQPTLDKPILEKPMLVNPTLENPTQAEPILAKPTLAEPTLENPTQLNTYVLNTKQSNTYENLIIYCQGQHVRGRLYGWLITGHTFSRINQQGNIINGSMVRFSP